MKKFSIKSFIAGFSIALVLMIGTVAFASDGLQTIEVLFNNIKVSINGNEVQNMDVEPFIYQDRTFLPIRFVAENLGMDVKFNETTNTVELVSNNNLGENKLKTDLISTVEEYIKNTNQETYVRELFGVWNRTKFEITSYKYDITTTDSIIHPYKSTVTCKTKFYSTKDYTTEEEATKDYNFVDVYESDSTLTYYYEDGKWVLQH